WPARVNVLTFPRTLNGGRMVRGSMVNGVDRRTFLGVLGAAFTSASARAVAQGPVAQPLPVPPEVTRDWSGRDPVRYPDPDIVALDARFRRYIIGNTTIK